LDGEAVDGCGLSARLHAELQARAHALWEMTGEPDPLKNWLDAERSLLVRTTRSPLQADPDIEERDARIEELEALLQSTKAALISVEADRGDRLRNLEHALADRDLRFRQAARLASREVSKRDSRIQDLEVTLAAVQRGVAMKEQALQILGGRLEDFHVDVLEKLQGLVRGHDFTATDGHACAFAAQLGRAERGAIARVPEGDEAADHGRHETVGAAALTSLSSHQQSPQQQQQQFNRCSSLLGRTRLVTCGSGEHKALRVDVKQPQRSSSHRCLGRRLPRQSWTWRAALAVCALILAFCLKQRVQRRPLLLLHLRR